MNGNIGFLVKILLASASISYAIKYLAPVLAVPSTSAVALGMVLVPPVVTAIALIWRSRQSSAS